MNEKNILLITPKTKVGELLDRYPELEPVLMDLAPAFKKLKNPVLRRTVGKVATLQQAASLGNVPVTEIINTLRSEIGQELYDGGEIQNGINYDKPEWFDEGKVMVRFDASPIINKGENPMQAIFNHLDQVKKDGIFQLVTPFVPAPIIELIAKKEYSHYCIQQQSTMFHTYFYHDSNLS